jgi:hypothetical protein
VHSKQDKLKQIHDQTQHKEIVRYKDKEKSLGGSQGKRTYKIGHKDLSPSNDSDFLIKNHRG